MPDTAVTRSLRAPETPADASMSGEKRGVKKVQFDTTARTLYVENCPLETGQLTGRDDGSTWSSNRHMTRNSVTCEKNSGASLANQTAASDSSRSILGRCQGCGASTAPVSGRWVDGVWSCPDCQDHETIPDALWRVMTADDVDVPEQLAKELQGAPLYVAATGGEGV